MKQAIYKQAFVVLLVNCSQFVTCSCPKLHILFASISYFTKTSQKMHKLPYSTCYKYPGKSSFPCLSCLWYFSPEVIAKCLPKWPAWNSQWSYFARGLEVVYKQVRIYLISYNLQLACLRKLEVMRSVSMLHQSWIINELGKPLFEMCWFYMGIAQIALDPPSIKRANVEKKCPKP